MKARRKRKGKGKAGKQTHRDKLQKFMDSVNNFVKSQGGLGENGGDQRRLFARIKVERAAQRETYVKESQKEKSLHGSVTADPQRGTCSKYSCWGGGKDTETSPEDDWNLKNTAQKQQRQIKTVLILKTMKKRRQKGKSTSPTICQTRERYLVWTRAESGLYRGQYRRGQRNKEIRETPWAE